MATRLNLLRWLTRSFNAGNLQIGTCPICHGLVDIDAEEAHLWWHEQNDPKPQTYETRPIKIGRHHI